MFKIRISARAKNEFPHLEKEVVALSRRAGRVCQHNDVNELIKPLLQRRDGAVHLTQGQCDYLVHLLTRFAVVAKTSAELAEEVIAAPDEDTIHLQRRRDDRHGDPGRLLHPD